MTARRSAQLIAVGSIVLTGFLLLISACGTPGHLAAVRPAATAGVTGTAGTATATRAPSRQHATSAIGARTLVVRDTLGSCERRLKNDSRGLPTVAIVGASYTAGVGPDDPSLSWAAVLARTLRWNAVIYGVPGAGYVAKGYSELGPIVRMLGTERLRSLDPSLVIVQAGHDDNGVPPALERRQVRRVIEQIRAQAPQAKIALLTVFTRPDPAHWLVYHRIDQAIVTAARAADPATIIMDPLAGRWKYAHFDDVDLHPTASGDAQIARRVAGILGARGITAAARTGAPVFCRVSVGLGEDETHSTARDE